ncbi:MAG: hypothetical protein IJL31_03360 [Oscillospiraceae bacterium]|jgi:hypothetical protein|nr:hypothetical protein [Oscillospiraceae bacterium]MEE3459931.1 hypothetical protein [Candidatus Faecousia sp.]
MDPFRKTERAMKLLRERNEANSVETVGNTDKDVDLEKGDIPAMLTSAYLTILPAVILALLCVVGIPVLIVLLLAG